MSAGASAGVVIVGTGQAGFQVAASLRSEGYDGAITLIGEEPELPYQRPPLSKSFLMAETQNGVHLRQESFYSGQRIDLLTGERVSWIDLRGRSVQVSSRHCVPFAHLVLATGARNRRIETAADGICYLRTLAEAVQIRERLSAARNVVILGGGFVGLELAAAARSLGKEVLVVEFQQRLLSRVAAPLISNFYRDLHRSHGVRFAFGVMSREFRTRSGGSRVREVELSDGTIHPADLVVAGIGVIPNTELAEGCGLPVTAGGIVVDEYLKTSDAGVFAIGDCAFHPNRFAGGGAVRIESVQNAVDQARCVAATIAGRPCAYQAVPWFWTDQFDVKLQTAGLSSGSDLSVIRGVPESGKFSVLYFKQNELAAIDSINWPADHMAARKLLARRAPITPWQAADQSLDLLSVPA